jgi:undecaprenyl-diphosphatase
MNSITQLDLRMLFWFAKIQQRSNCCLVGKLISKSGDGYLQVALPIFFFIANESDILALLCLYAFALERPLYFILKNILKRSRPTASIPNFHSVIIASDEFSFPSGHTSAAFLLAFISWEYSMLLGFTLMIWASLVGCSRVLLGVHFPTDILAGASLGTGIGYTFIQMS